MDGDVMYDAWSLVMSVLGVTFSITQILLVLKTLTRLKRMQVKTESDGDKTSLQDMRESQYRIVEDERNVLRVELDKARQQRAKLTESGLAFLSCGPHELRTRLSAILGLSELLQRPQLEEARRIEFSRLIQKRGNDLLYLSNNLIEFLKIQSGKISLIKVGMEVGQLFKEINEEYNAILPLEENREFVFQYEMSLSCTTIFADPVRLKQVLVSLVRNSFQFTPAGGTIQIGCQEKDTKLLFYVSDMGIGIPREYRGAIFDPFVKVPQSISGVDGGIGLGLAICKGLVSCWGGEIGVDSIEGRGSVFYFTIPYGKEKIPFI